MPVDKYQKKVNQIKNKLAIYDQQTVLNCGLWYLDREDKDQQSVARSMPFLTFLLIKWSMQIAVNGVKKISHAEFLKLANDLYQLQAAATDFDSGGTVELKLRPMLMQQGAPQVSASDDLLAFARQKIWFDQAEDRYYEETFQRISGLSISAFFSISCYFVINASSSKIFKIDIGTLLVHLTPSVTIDDLCAYLRFVGVSNKKLPAFMAAHLENEAPKYEYYAETPLILKPVILLGTEVVIANRRLFIRSMASYLSNALKLADGRKFKEHFGPTLEGYVSKLLREVSANHQTEQSIKTDYEKYKKTGKIVDFIIEDRLRIFMDCKAIEPNDFISTCTDPQLLATRLKESYTKAIWQGQECCFTFDQISTFEKKAPFMLVVVHRDHYLSNGKRLAEYLDIDLESQIKEKFGYIPIPLGNIYYVTIHDFERLLSTYKNGKGKLSEILEMAVRNDAKPETAMFLFSMHLSGSTGIDDASINSIMIRQFETLHREILENADFWDGKAKLYLQYRSKMHRAMRDYDEVR